MDGGGKALDHATTVSQGMINAQFSPLVIILLISLFLLVLL